MLVGLILALTALGPFGSYETPVGPRLLHWSMYLVTGYAFFRPVIAAGGALSRQTGLPRAAAIAAACALGAFPTSMVIVFASAGSDWESVRVGGLVTGYLQTLIIGATVTIVQLLARRDAPRVEHPAKTDPEPEPIVVSPEALKSDGLPAFLDLMPPHLRGEVLCLENEDHYLRVHSVHGSAMILMRMRDAVAQLDGKGVRVHRSWWVARAAVVDTVRQDRNLRLRLADGREVPVARAMVPELRALGWLRRESFPS